MAASQWNKWISQPGHIRVVAVEATTLVRELAKVQQLTGLAQQGYGEAVVGASLIASAHKSNESININAQGSGVFRQAIIDASPDGKLRGFLREQKDKSMHTFGAEGHNGPWGSGILSVILTKDSEGKYPYTGMIPIATGFLDEAINEYYKDSEQSASRVGLFVEFDGQELSRARGALVQAMGGASEAEVAAVESLKTQPLRALAQLADDQAAFINQASQLLSIQNFKNIETQKLTAYCNCSQERIERALALTGQKEIKEALGKDPYLTITCDFCRKEFRLSSERIKSLFSRDPSRLQ